MKKRTISTLPRREFLKQTTASILALSSASLVQSSTAAAATNRVLKTYVVPQTELVISRLAYGTAFLEFDWLSDEFTAKAMQAIRIACELGLRLGG